MPGSPTSTPITSGPVPPSLSTGKISGLLGSLQSKVQAVGSDVSEKLSAGLPQHPALDSLSHQIRTFRQHHVPSSTSPVATRPVQRVITNAKGVALDFLAVGRDSALAAKEAFEFGQTLEEPELRDATDRLAYLSFSAATLATDLAKNLDLARQPLKDLRDLNNAVISKTTQLEQAQGPKSKRSEDEVEALQRDLAHLRASLPLRRREAIIQTNQATFKAHEEYASKVLLLSHAAGLILPTLEGGEYSVDFTSHVRNSAQAATEKWSPGQYVKISDWPEGGLASSAASFAESHATHLSELSRDPESGLAITTNRRKDSLPSDIGRRYSQELVRQHSGAQIMTSLGQSHLNLSPVLLPQGKTSESDENIDQLCIKGTTPTVAETGVPLQGSSGPSSGQLKPRTSSSGSLPALPPRHISTSELPPVFALANSTGPISDQTENIEARARASRRGSLNPYNDAPSPADKGKGKEKEDEAEGDRLPEYSIEGRDGGERV